MTRLRVWEVLRFGWRGLRSPWRSLREIPGDASLPYARLLPGVIVVSLLGAIFHYYVVGQQWVFQIPFRGAVHALSSFALAPIVWGGPTGLGLYCAARWFRRSMSLGWCDLVAFRLWMVWCASLLVDCLHLLPGVSMRVVGVWWGGHVQFVMHAGWFFLFPMLLIQLTACWRELTGSLRLGILLAAAGLALMRLGAEPLPEIIAGVASRTFHIGWDYWVVAWHVSWAGAIPTLLARWWIARRDRRLHARSIVEMGAMSAQTVMP
ncbi:MAG: hypothetical protein COV75_08090 [Candidatus Omnitrophica bacterium CG11_big_fil_rev_8_21_14_0_20_63_9]|nr:MAG: hypothetical protein COV75_08090 [Candidatus Omnitrophica bacterium CG11_big_fil_rev_8_21_14_0_20_63_9]